MRINVVLSRALFVGMVGFFGGTGLSEARSLEIAPFYGYRFGGEFSDSLSGNSVQVDPSASAGATINVPLPRYTDYLEFLYSYQDSELSSPLQAKTIGVRTEMYQLGINRDFPGGNDQVRPFLVGLLGATTIDFTGNLGSESLFSLGLGGGVKYFPTENIGLRLDVRGFVSIVDGAGGIACSGGCVAAFQGSAFFQGEIAPSLVIAF